MTVKPLSRTVVPLKLGDSFPVNFTAPFSRIYRRCEQVLKSGHAPPRASHRIIAMTFTFMIGAIVGSSLFIAVGGPPARRLMAVIQERVKNRSRG